MLYLITYDKELESKELIEKIKSLDSWLHYFETTWLVVSSESADTIYRKLGPPKDNSKHILVIRIKLNDDSNASIQGWLPQKAWDWIRRNYTK